MKLFLSLVGILCILTLTEAKVSAGSVLASGITASPALEQLKLSVGQSTLVFTTKVTNNTKTTISLDISAQDFTSLNQNGGIDFLTSNDNPHGLSSSIHIGQKQVQLNPGQTQTVTFTITGANTLAAGGHYGAIIYKVLGPNLTPYNTVTVNQAVTTLVFLTTASQGTQELSLTSPPFGRYLSSFPSSVDAVFANNGNTQTAARGLIQVVDSKAKLVSKGILNADSGLILPDSKRLFTVTLQPQTTNYLWPGLYTARILYHYEGQAKLSEVDETFLYISIQQIAITITIFIALPLTIIIYLKKTWLKPRLRFGR